MNLLLTNLDGRLTLKGMLGVGGMGEVHRAWDAGLERPVAVKFVRSADPKEADRLLLEARLQARVEHPNVVRVHDTGKLEGRPCILLQLVEGKTFADLDPVTTWQMKVRLAAQAARGLDAAHRMGLVHRDVKPANILVEATTEGPQALLSDFGLARDEEGGLTRSGLMMGSVDFMAPEQVTGATPVDFRADVYGLGATLYAVLVGRPPFRHSSAGPSRSQNADVIDNLAQEIDLNPGDMLRRVLEQEPPSLVAEVPGLPRDLAVVVAKAMEKEPARRYITAGAFADDLERVLKGEAIQARPMGWVEQGTRWMRRNPLAARAVGIGLLAVIAALAFASWNSRRSTLAALEAAQMGGEAKALELRLRMAHLAPAHDLRPVKAELRNALLRLQARTGAAASASAYAQGRIYLILGEVEHAQTSLERAWALGFRGADLEEALAIVYSQLFEQARQGAERLKEPAYRKLRLLEVDHLFRQPALRHFQAAGADQVLSIRRAMMEQNYESARDLAQEARRMDPERAEAGLLELQAWMKLMGKAYDQQDLEESERCGRSGLALVDTLANQVRSDPEVHILAGGLHAFLTSLHQRRGLPFRADADAGLREVGLAMALDAGSHRPLMSKALILANLSRAPKAPGDPSRLEYCQAGVDVCRLAARLAPESARPLAPLAYSLYDLGGAQAEAGLDPGPSLREGRATGIRMAAMEPWNPSGLQGAFNCAETEARSLLDRGQDASEPLGAAQALAEQLHQRSGVTEAYKAANRGQLELLMAQDDLAKARDPESHFLAAFEAFEAHRRLEPNQTNAAFYTGWLAVNWMEGRIALGRPVADVQRLGLPVVEAAHARWPKETQLLSQRAKLLILPIRAGPELPQGAAVDPLSAARHALREARASLTAVEAGDLGAWLAVGEGSRAEARRALSYFQSAVRSRPGDLGILEGLVKCRIILGSPDAALRALDALEPALARRPEVLCLRVRTLRALGRLGDAEQLTQRVKSEHPTFAQHAALKI